MELSQLCKEVQALSKTVGSFILSEAKTFNTKSVEYKGKNDLVSYVDKTAESKLVEGLKSFLPKAGFITEENTESSEGIYQWVIDPLDGTTNFVHGLPCYCISIALIKDKEPILGVIYEPNLGECFYATKKGGSYLNGIAIKVTETNLLEQSLLATGFPYHDYGRLNEYMQVFDYCIHHTHGIRRWGSAAIDLAYVACGRFEGFYEYGLNAWDVAAGVILVKEAGGTVSDFCGENNAIFGKEIIATNQNIHQEFLGIVKEKFSAS